MAKHGKKYREVAAKAPSDVVEVIDAVTFLKESSSRGFDERLRGCYCRSFCHNIIPSSYPRPGKSHTRAPEPDTDDRKNNERGQEKNENHLNILISIGSVSAFQQYIETGQSGKHNAERDQTAADGGREIGHPGSKVKDKLVQENSNRCNNQCDKRGLECHPTPC